MLEQGVGADYNDAHSYNQGEDEDLLKMLATLPMRLLIGIKVHS